MGVRLEWVFAPVVSDGRVIYRYRNAGDEEAGQIWESVDVFVGSGSLGMQQFSMPALAVAGEQETHVPLGSAIPDGEVTVTVQVNDEVEAQINGRVALTAQGGAVYPKGEAPAVEHWVQPTISAVDVAPAHVDITWHVDGSVVPDVVSPSIVLEQNGAEHWTGHAPHASGAQGVTRIDFAGDLVHGGEGWSLKVVVSCYDSPTQANGAAQVHVPIAADEHGQVHATGPMWMGVADI